MELAYSLFRLCQRRQPTSAADKASDAVVTRDDKAALRLWIKVLVLQRLIVRPITTTHYFYPS
jgi:hypothetical protein